jgi:hypothetical protein
MKTTKGVYARFFVLLHKMKGAEKEEIVWQYSGMRTGSLHEFHEMDAAGYDKMIEDMQKTVNSFEKDLERETKMLRSSILFKLQKYGVDTTNWTNVNRFLEQNRIAGKRLYEMNCEEMRALITKLGSILDKEKKREAEEIRQAIMN